MIHCPECDTVRVVKNGKRGENVRFKCKDCGNSFLDIHVKNHEDIQAHETSFDHTNKLNKKIDTSGVLKAELTPEGERLSAKITEAFDEAKKQVLDSEEGKEYGSVAGVASTDSAEVTETEEVPTVRRKKVSTKASHVYLRSHKYDLFSEPQYSKKFGFEFNSWAEYFAKRYKLRADAEKAAREIQASE